MGYFKASLPMRRGEHGDFRPLGEMYISLDHAFMDPVAMTHGG